MNDIPRRLAQVRERIADAAGRAGRSPGDVRLIAVSKTHPIDAVRAAADAGQLDFGENKVQEALQKIAQSADTRLRWHLVGHLQSNKARKAAAAVQAIHSIDGVDLLRKVDQAAEAAAERLRCWSRSIWLSKTPSSARRRARWRGFSRPRHAARRPGWWA